MRIVEWCYTDRVTRQFDFLQRIPTSSPHIGHHTFHGSSSGWHLSMKNVIERWEHRHEGIIAAPTYMPSRRPMSVDGYHTWYDRVTRRYMINPTLWAFEEGFLGSQGLLPVAAEGLSNDYHEIQRSEVVADDPIVDSALQGMEVTLDDTGFHVLQPRRPHPPPMVPTGCRRHRTRGGSTSLAFPHPRPAPLEGYVPWGRATARGGSAGHGFTGSPWEHTILGHGHGSTRSTGSTSQHTYQRGLDRLLRIFMMPERGFQPFMSHDTSESRYASPVIREDDDDDDEEPHDVQVRQQPPER
ncbi:hypothetical protein AgCh_009258 [Apium graveolens]